MLNCDDHQLLLNSLQDLQSRIRAARTAYTSMIAAGGMPKPDPNAAREIVKYPPPTAIGKWKLNDTIDMRGLGEATYCLNVLNVAAYDPSTGTFKTEQGRTVIDISVSEQNKALSMVWTHAFQRPIYSKLYSNGSDDPDTVIYSWDGAFISAEKTTGGVTYYGSVSKDSEEGQLIRSFEVVLVLSDNESQPVVKVLERIATRI